MLAKFDWEYKGTLSNITATNSKGIYLLVYRGNPNRIIYVGTTNCFKRRLNQHREGMIAGQRTVWRVKENEDIYALMSYKGEKEKYKYYYSLAKKGLLWASTTLEKEQVQNDLKKKDNFETEWKDFVSNNYINKIDIWTCDLNGCENRIIQLESQIQRAFKSNFFIGSHIHKEGMCWLGKIENLEDVYSYRFDFKRYPTLDEDSIKLLKNLTDKRVIGYEKLKHTMRKQEKKEKLEELKKKYIYAGDKWQPKENDIIYSLCRLGISYEDIAVNYLKRSPEEVKKRIEYIGKYYDMSKKS